MRARLVRVSEAEGQNGPERQEPEGPSTLLGPSGHPERVEGERRRRLPFLVLALVCACAAPQRPAPAAPSTAASPPLEGEVQRPSSAGYFPLPPALAVDPRTLPIAPLPISVVRPERLVLPNGLTVYLMQDRTVPLVTVRAMIATGDFDEPAEKLGAAAVLFDLLASGGAGKRSAAELDELLAFHAADAWGSAGQELSSLNLSLRSEHLAKLFPVFADMLLRPKLERGRFEVTIGRYVEAVRRRPDSPDGLAARALAKAIFGPDSVFAREPTERTLRALTVEDLRAFHRRALVPRGTRLIVTGDFDRAALLELVNAHLGGWRGGAPLEPSFPGAPKLSRRVIVVPKKVPQAKIRIGGLGFARRSPDEYPTRVVTTALGAFGVGRLYREIRDTRGLAYSAYAAVHPGPTTGLFLVGVDTRPSAAGEAVEAALEILGQTAGASPLSPRELSTAQDMYLNSFAFRFDSAEKIAWEKAMLDGFGYPEDYLDRYREQISAVTPADAAAAAGALVKLDALQIVVVGPPEELGDLSRFGPVTVISDVEAFR